MSLCPAGKYCLGLCHDHNATSWRAILRMPPPYDPLHNATVGVVRPIRWVPALDTLCIEERACLRVPAVQPCSYLERTNGRQPRREFVVGYLFSYRCFDGTQWSAYVRSVVDGSISKRRAKFSASHATLDPDRACSAAQDCILSLSKAATRLTEMKEAGDTFLYVRCVMCSSSVPGTITTA